MDCFQRYNLDREILRKRFSDQKAPQTDLGFKNNGLKRAAILIPLFCKDGDIHLLFIRRTDKVQDHKGQVSFPGGMAEDQDHTPIDTALRETYEEIGLSPGVIDVLGMLPPMETATGYEVTPVIGRFTWPDHFSVNDDEVERIFSIPLEWLFLPDHHSLRPYTRPNGQEALVTFFEPYDNELLWGITAEITLNFIRRLKL